MLETLHISSHLILMTYPQEIIYIYVDIYIILYINIYKYIDIYLSIYRYINI